MRTSQLACLGGFLALVSVLGATPSAAFTQLFAFGDSLSDTGNTISHFDGAPNGTCATATYAPSPPYAGGACTNGDTWLEVLAAELGLSAEPGTSGGTNFAVGGASAATDALGAFPPLDFDGDTEDISDQLDRFLAANPVVDPDALYVIVAGANDLQFAARGWIAPGSVVQDAVDAIMDTALALSGLGAQNFLFANVFDLGLIPDTTLTPAMRSAATSLGQEFNAAIAAAAGSFSGGTAFFLDVAAVYDAVYANPGAFGITNTTSACVISGVFGPPQNVGTPCGQSLAIQDTYLYFDEIHPSRVVHAEMGAAALAAVGEPVGAWLLGAAVVMAAMGSRAAPARP